MIFAWHVEKAVANLKKHGVDFREAATVFGDPLSTTFPDEDHSIAERRFLTIGESLHGQLLVVAHTEENTTIRIISARRAMRNERKF
ncbi:MAG TPA: BrnT family toxin, partial [Candidatus Angelobacter sp.]|nr:BrnT family toxin [Candidatus Angelobacter sp.]